MNCKERLTIKNDGAFAPKECYIIDKNGKSNGCKSCEEVCSDIYDGCEDCPIQKCFDKLGELEDKLENGTLIELPCKVGDTVYEVKFKCKCDMCSENHIEFKGTKNIDHCINYKKEHNGNCPVKSKAWIDELNFDLSMFSLATMNLTHNIFATKEEAEARLKELQDER